MNLDISMKMKYLESGSLLEVLMAKLKGLLRGLEKPVWKFLGNEKEKGFPFD